ncbi:MAG: biotin--[acetyl-CoA-carboxylase] ligase [Cellvibrionales bacterium]|nr:MAG: biotin--[acetyl-CoA-carboxylase] ligase [Cellvibrionales bacterium]
MPSWSAELQHSASAQMGARLAQLAAQRVASVDSTNSALLRSAQAGDYNPQVLWADAQTAGRGRMGRVWHSAAASLDASCDTSSVVAAGAQRSLTFSIALPFAPQDWSGLSLVVGLAATEVLGDGIALKWPNDIVVRRTAGYAKLGGILLETQALPEAAAADLAAQTGLPCAAARWLVIGMGLNLQGQPISVMASEAKQSTASAESTEKEASMAALRAPAADLAQALPSAQAQALLADVPALCSHLVLAILQAALRFERTGFAPFAPAFAQRDVLLGQSVATYQDEQCQQQGLALGVALDGSYRLRLPDGSERGIHSAEISLRPAAQGMGA